MKKIILLLGILCMGFQCGDDYVPIVNYGEWWVKNTTDQTIIIKPGGRYDFRPVELLPGTAELLIEKTFHIVDMPNFVFILDRWNGWAKENIFFEVLSRDGTSLIGWNYADRNLPGRQFFHESSWARTQSTGKRVDEIKITWLFEIADGDIHGLK